MRDGYSISVFLFRELIQNGLLFECSSNPWEVHWLLQTLWAPVCPFIIHHTTGWPNAAFCQCWHEPGTQSILPRIFPTYMCLCPSGWIFDPPVWNVWLSSKTKSLFKCFSKKLLYPFLLVQAHLSQHHRSIPPYGQIAPCCQHSEVYPCRRQTQRPGRCG